MGKYLWRKHSYVRVEDDHPGCIWTIFHILNYHPWHNVRKMLPYKKHNPHGKSNKNRGIMPEEDHQIISRKQEFEHDSILNHSASVNSNASTNGSTSKRSIKARIRALMKEKNSSTKSDLTVDKPNFQGHEGKWDNHNNAPSLMDLLKANPKLLRSASRINDSNDMLKSETKDSKKKDEFVGVLELFNVDQDLFIQILQDNSPRKPRLVKSGTFPSRNPANNFGTTPSKVEHKHNEIWPVSSNVHEEQKAKSQGVVRSSSLTESLGKFGYLFDTSSNKAIKRHLSKSLDFRNEKEFALWGDLLTQRSCKERLDLPVSESHSLTTTEPLSRISYERGSNKSEGEARLLRLDSTKDNQNLVALQTEEKPNWSIFEEEQVFQETNDDVKSQDGEIQITECSISEDIRSMSDITSASFRKTEDSQDSIDHFSTEYNNQDYQYVKYVLDILGFVPLEHQHEAWHSQYQPIDPALFDGIEFCCPFEPISSNKGTNSNMSSSHRKVLFDLISEALLNIHDETHTYYPKALSYWCQVRKGKIRSAEEVWEFVEEYLSWKPEVDPSLDLAVANDLSRDKNGWVNLQMDTEGLALELEDWIFDDLLDEIVD